MIPASQMRALAPNQDKEQKDKLVAAELQELENVMTARSVQGYTSVFVKGRIFYANLEVLHSKGYTVLTGTEGYTIFW